MKKNTKFIIFAITMVLTMQAAASYAFADETSASESPVVDMTNIAVADTLVAPQGPGQESNIIYAPGTNNMTIDGHIHPFAGNEGCFKYFALGNSITIHPVTDFWFTECGMSASSIEKDFFHQVMAGLQTRYGKTVCAAYNFHVWEKNPQARTELLAQIDDYLDPSLDLISVQLGENVSDNTNFTADFQQLIQYIKAKCPNAYIVVIDDFWPEAEHTTSKINISYSENVKFVNLVKIKDNPYYQCGMGTVVTDAEGKTHVVDSASVATHPGDAGMEYIAKKTLAMLDTYESEARGQ